MLRKRREKMFERSTESIRVFFKFTLISANIIKEAIIPLMNVNYVTLTPGFKLKSAEAV